MNWLALASFFFCYLPLHIDGNCCCSYFFCMKQYLKYTWNYNSFTLPHQWKCFFPLSYLSGGDHFFTEIWKKHTQCFRSCFYGNRTQSNYQEKYHSGGSWNVVCSYKFTAGYSRTFSHLSVKSKKLGDSDLAIRVFLHFFFSKEKKHFTNSPSPSSWQHDLLCFYTKLISTYDVIISVTAGKCMSYLILVSTWFYSCRNKMSLW